MVLKKGSVESDGTILCWGSGVRCVSTLTDRTGEEEVPVFLKPYSEDSPRYDADLVDLATKVNDLLKETHEKRKNKDLRLGLLVMGQGLLPVWKREIGADEDPADYVDVDELVHLDGKTDVEIGQALGFKE